MTRFAKLLSGGDLRSIGKSNAVIDKIRSQKDFDDLFEYLFHADRIIVMRAADAIEKITVNNPKYLSRHKKKVLGLSNVAKDKELKWHLALLMCRLELDENEFAQVWHILTAWARDKNNSRIVRVNSIQGLFDLKSQRNELEKDLALTLAELEKENVPSLNARMKRLKKVKQ